MQPADGPPVLPFTVRADREGARRRRRVAIPVLVVAALVGGASLGVLFAEMASGPTASAWWWAGAVVVAAAVYVVAAPRTRRPPSVDWSFRLEPDGLRFPPHHRAVRTQPGHPGLLVPWELITSLTRRRRNGEATIMVGLRPEAEAVLLGQGAPVPNARFAVRRGMPLRLVAVEVDPARCLQLLESTRAARTAYR